MSQGPQCITPQESTIGKLGQTSNLLQTFYAETFATKEPWMLDAAKQRTLEKNG